jgi:hypothetical protein
MMVESSFRLAESSPREAWLPVLWNLDDLKRSQEIDARDDGDWALAPRPRVGASAADAARREFLSAMEAWDVERADRAVVALAAHHGHDELFELLWPIVARCYAFIGHKMIYAAQVERALRRIGWRHAEPALRSLVMTTLVNRETSAFERSRELARSFPKRWQSGKDDPEQSRQLLAALRTRTPRESQDLVLGAFRDGLGPRTVWDALLLFGAELFHRRRGRTASAGRLALLPVHALTVTSAFGHAWRAAKADGTRRVLVLQAAAWLAAMRDDLAKLADLSMDGPGVDTLGVGIEGSAASLAAALERASPEHVRVYLDRRPGDAARYLSHLRTALFRKGQEHHQHKYAAAAQEESERVHPRWASCILAPAIDYLGDPAAAETEVYTRSVHTLRKAGVAAARAL